MEVYVAFFIQTQKYVCAVRCSLAGLQQSCRSIRITFWNRATRDNEETTQCGWLTVSGRDIFISSH